VPGGRVEPEGSLQLTAAQRVIARVVFSIAGELRRLRSDEWIDLAADEIAGDPSYVGAQTGSQTSSAATSKR